MTTRPIPQRPEDSGVPSEVPDLAQIEGAHLLADKAGAFLTECGFTDE
jgi:hypothetical protein